MKLIDLFKPGGVYWYKEGINVKALVSTIIGGLFSLVSVAIPSLSLVYDYGWYFAILVSMVTFLVISRQEKER